MPHVLSAVARWPVYGPVVSGLDFFARTTASWIEITQPAERERAAHWAWLFAIIAVGVFVRFWGLGAVGFHGDEETMAMAVSHVLIDGAPRLPSGMFYPRGLSQQILMVGSAGIFGMSEWSMRFPSAIAGILLIPLSFLLGRRFLTPTWNVAFVAGVAFLPEFVVYSQTARMYIFLLVTIAVSMGCVFQWETNGRPGWLIVGVVSMIIGIELHALAAFSSLVFLMPGIVRGDPRKLIQGCCATFCVLFGYLVIDSWVNAQYPVPPSDFASDLPPPSWREGPRAMHVDIAQYAFVFIGGILASVSAYRLAASVKDRSWAIAIGALAVATVALQLFRFYHLAAFSFVAAAILVVRYENGRVPRGLIWFASFCAALAVLQAALLYVGGIHSPTKLVGSMVGQPSVWPYVRVAGYSEVAAILCASMLITALVRFARRQPVSDYTVLAVLTIGIPLVVMGLFLWDLPVRYTASSALPLLLCGFAFAQSATQSLTRKLDRTKQSRWHAAIAIVLAVLMVNPIAFASVVNPGYDLHPDHKGAAEFIRSQNIKPEDVVLAEDVLQQTLYLGSVDYWLIGKEHARRFVNRVEGRIVDFYTGTPVITNAVELEALYEREAGHRIFIIGSGEGKEDQRLDMRGKSLQDALRSDRLKVVYNGRDGFTRVWQVVTHGPAAAAVPKSPVAAQPEPKKAQLSSLGAARSPD
jgi:hypothetical protein